jgi:hypothetical protein
VRARIHNVKIASVVPVNGMFEKGYPLSVRRNPRVADIAIGLEQNLANGIFELLRSARAAHNGNRPSDSFRVDKHSYSISIPCTTFR